MGYEQILIRKSTMRNQDMIIAQSGRLVVEGVMFRYLATCARRGCDTRQAEWRFKWRVDAPDPPYGTDRLLVRRTVDSLLAYFRPARMPQTPMPIATTARPPKTLA